MLANYLLIKKEKTEELINPMTRTTHYENKPIQNILNILPPKNESFQMKILKFLIFLLKT